MIVKYTGKYRKMADAFRADGADEVTIEKFVREEMEYDRLAKNRDVTEAAAYRQWQDLSERDRQMLQLMNHTNATIFVIRNGKEYWRGTLDDAIYEEPYSYPKGYVTESIKARLR